MLRDRTRTHLDESRAVGALGWCAFVGLVAAQISVLAFPATHHPAVPLPAYLLALLATAPVIVARTYPNAAVTAIAAGVVGFGALGFDGHVANATAMVPALVVLTRPWRADSFLPALMAAVLVGFAGSTPDMNFGWTCMVVLVPFLAALGSDLRVTLDATERTLDRVEDAYVRHRDDLAAMARHSRERIARDIHDTVSHSLSIVVTQAAMGRQLGANDPAIARRSLQVVRRVTTDTLDELDRADGFDGVGLANGRVDQQVGSEVVARRVDAVVGAAVHAGQDVTLDWPVAPFRLAPPAADAVVRSVQECLTNARRHAPGATVVVGVRLVGGHVRLVIANGPATSTAPVLESGGYGLVGLRERAELAGGHLSAVRDTDGGFLVQLVVPVVDVATPMPSDQPDTVPPGDRESNVSRIVIAVCGAFSLAFAVLEAGLAPIWLLTAAVASVAVLLSRRSPIVAFALLATSVASFALTGWGHYILILLVMTLIPIVRLVALRRMVAVALCCAVVCVVFFLLADGGTRFEELLMLMQGFWIVVICVQIAHEHHAAGEVERGSARARAAQRWRTIDRLDAEHEAAVDELERAVRSSITSVIATIDGREPGSSESTPVEILGQVEVVARAASADLRHRLAAFRSRVWLDEVTGLDDVGELAAR